MGKWDAGDAKGLPAFLFFTKFTSHRVSKDFWRMGKMVELPDISFLLSWFCQSDVAGLSTSITWLGKALGRQTFRNFGECIWPLSHTDRYWYCIELTLKVVRFLTILILFSIKMNETVQKWMKVFPTIKLKNIKTSATCNQTRVMH